ncbi:hypothetical protein [Methylovirgula sp. 4M-Z18]|uniref:hypothetical protein n=1 Tax=Methylovirgula sp. 4M-Z18 TaxID=2293567 RepID=UPI000E2F86EC|nr:hypothetical protein [Methylovirgula sp. 4M-Z18]RFB80394.1 hypothetical protein DYH55_02380 [Methylovirgula sp. 4M-Z18]
MTTPRYGMVFNNVNNEPRPAQPSDLSIIGLVLPSDDAIAATYPLDTPIAFDSGDATALAALGTGPLYKTVVTIDNQLADLQTSARIVAVRVATGADIDATIANIAGNPANGSGLYALLKAKTLLGEVPRLIGAPGYTGTSDLGVQSVTITGGGTGFTNAPVTFNPPGATGTAIIANGVVTGVNLTAPGQYDAGTVVTCSIGGDGKGATVSGPTLTGGAVGVAATGAINFVTNPVVGNTITLDGTVVTFGTAANDVVPGATLAATLANLAAFCNASADANISLCTYAATATALTITDKTLGVGGNAFTLAANIIGATATVAMQALANPICANLPAICAALFGCAVVGSDGSGQQGALNFRQVLSDPRLIPTDAWEIIQSPIPAGQTVSPGTEYQDGAAVALGLFARVDFQHEGLPFWSISGQPVQGILGLKNSYPFSLVDGATAGQELLAQNISVIERGEIGDETAISASGYVWAGVWNASSDPLQWFYNKRRGRDWTHLALMKSIRLRLGTENVTPQGVQDVLNDMNAVGSYLIMKKAVLGFKVSFNAADNSVDALRQGQFAIAYNQEEPAPITQVTVNSGPYREALTFELSTLIAQAAQLPAQFLN